MKTTRLALPLVLLLAVVSVPDRGSAQLINNGAFAPTMFQMDIDLTAATGSWILQSSPAVTGPWTAVPGGPYVSPLVYPTVIDPGSGPATPARFYRLRDLSGNCGLNRYGFIRKVIPTGFCMISCPLLADAGNTLANLIPTAADQTTYYKYCGTWAIDTWDLGFGSWFNGVDTLNPGEGCYLFNPLLPFPVTFIGEVPEGVLTTPLPAGFCMVSSRVPQAGLLETQLLLAPIDQDTVYQFDCITQTFSVNTYDVSLGGWINPEPVIGLAEAFWMYAPSSHNWTRTFSACP